MSSLMETWPRRHRITVEEYYRMAEVGLLAPDARVELIEGEIIDMAPIGTDHCSVVDQLNRQFVTGRRHVSATPQHARSGYHDACRAAGSERRSVWNPGGLIL